MKVTRQQRSREQIAREEVGHTDVRRNAAILLVGAFLLAIFTVPIHQHLAEYGVARQQDAAYIPTTMTWQDDWPHIAEPWRRESWTFSSLFKVNRRMLQSIAAFEDRLEDESAFGQRVRPPMQAGLSGLLGVGNEEAYVGRDGWLFYRPGIDYLTGPGFLEPRQLARRAAEGNEWRAAPQPDPRKAIIDFHQQLAARDIQLIVMPTPIKPTIHSEQFSRRFDRTGPPLHNVSYSRLLDDLAAAGVRVYDPTSALHERKLSSDEAQYLATDTHWRPEAMEAIAADLADHLRRALNPDSAPDQGLRREPTRIEAYGDVALMLDLPPNQMLFPPEQVTVHSVFTADNQFWRASEEADVLLLGDSFSNIFSLEPMGWGEAAGFAEQLSYHLNAPIDRLVRNDSGAFATRDMLSRELARGRDRLAGKQVVIWQFAARELAVGDWRLIPLELREPPETAFFVPEPGSSQTVQGTVQAVSQVPRPGTVPYRDHILALHLVDLPDNTEAVVYLHSMRDNEWTAAARLRPGQTVNLELHSWSDFADQFDGINRSELDDWELQLQEPAWGMLLP